MPLAEALADGIAAGPRARRPRAWPTTRAWPRPGLEVDRRPRGRDPRRSPSVERALQTPTRERVQQEADRATFERRALAVERERAIAENELQNQIELARREEQLVAQRGANERRRADRRPRPPARIETAGRGASASAAAMAEAERRRDPSSSARPTAMPRRPRWPRTRDARRGRCCSALALSELAGNLPEIGT